MKIGLVGEYYSKNLGDPLLFPCTEYLWRKCSDKETEFYCIDFFGRNSTDMPVFNGRGSLPVLALKICRRIMKKAGARETLFLDEKIWDKGSDKKRLVQYFEEKLCGLDEVIVTGAGTIKYDVRLNFAPFYKELINCAEKYEIPVVVNCAGIESKYQPDDRRCRMFCEVLSRDIVKIITTRDDIDTLKQMVKNPKTCLAKIADIGVWSAETFGIRSGESNVTGLGIITPERFEEFKRDITPEQYEREWLNIIRELEDGGKKWMLFNNGDDCDRLYAEILCKKAGFNPEEKLRTPKTPEELVEIISGFRGIITSRLHSCIVAYSLNIPFLCIAWNNKLKYFTENIGCPERMIEAADFDSEEIKKRFEKAMAEGYDTKNRKEYRETTVRYIKKYIELAKKSKGGNAVTGRTTA